MARRSLAVDALRFFSVELCSYVDLGFGLGERLPLLRGEDQGKVAAVPHDQLEPAARDRRALLGDLLGPWPEGALLAGFVTASAGSPIHWPST